MMNNSENRKKSVLPATDLCLQTCCMDYIYGKKKPYINAFLHNRYRV